MERKNASLLITEIKAEIDTLTKKLEAIDQREFGLINLFNENASRLQTLGTKLKYYEFLNEKWYRITKTLDTESELKIIAQFEPEKKRKFLPE